MERYTIYCTAEQTKKAHKLGAPLNTWGFARELVIPTAEQMIEYMLDTGKGNSVELGFLIQTHGYKQGCLTFIDNYLK